jgi:hypothetical protein
VLVLLCKQYYVVLSIMQKMLAVIGQLCAAYAHNYIITASNYVRDRNVMLDCQSCLNGRPTASSRALS